MDPSFQSRTRRSARHSHEDSNHVQWPQATFLIGICGELFQEQHCRETVFIQESNHIKRDLLPDDSILHVERKFK